MVDTSFPRAVVFDLDGTLVDTAPDLCASLNHTLETMMGGDGYAPLPLADARMMAGQGAAFMLERAFATMGQPLSSEALSHALSVFLTHYRAHVAVLSKPFPYVKETLTLLRQHGVKLAVCTNKRTDLSRMLLCQLGLAASFDTCHGYEEGCPRKPDPFLLRSVLETLGLREGRQDIFMVGDSEADLGAAKACGMPIIGVGFGYGALATGALKGDAFIEDFRALVPCMRTLMARA